MRENGVADAGARPGEASGGPIPLRAPFQRQRRKHEANDARLSAKRARTATARSLAEGGPCPAEVELAPPRVTACLSSRRHELRLIACQPSVERAPTRARSERSRRLRSDRRRRERGQRAGGAEHDRLFVTSTSRRSPNRSAAAPATPRHPTAVGRRLTGHDGRRRLQLLHEPGRADRLHQSRCRPQQCEPQRLGRAIPEGYQRTCPQPDPSSRLAPQHSKGAARTVRGRQIASPAVLRVPPPCAWARPPLGTVA